MADGSKTVNVVIEGSGPYGFRLSGGDGEPMAITKLRRQGKGHQSGLREGDTVLGINGYSCQTLSHSAAMGLLESSVQSVELLIFRGQPEELISAYKDVGSQLRPLPPGAVPKPRVLPPPPSGEAGSLVIDQPSFTRPFSERFVVVDHPTVAAPPVSHSPRQPWNIELDLGDAYPPAVTAAPADYPAPGSWSTGLWQNRPLQTPVRWTPHQHQQPTNNVEEAEVPEFRAPSTDPKKPWMWKPPVTATFSAPSAVNTHDDMVAAWQQASLKHHEEEQQQERRRPQQPRGEDQIDGVPKWALPLRSDYDWKKSYPWLVDENVVFAEDEEWEYGYTNDGELIKRKKKIFADSSFYDDPNKKYPTIEEQIKMARKVALSLTAATNVKARGQRMFLRSREKADHWIVSELPPPTMAILLRRGLFSSGEHYQESAPSRGPVNDVDSDSEMLYYNPAPWQRPVGRGSGLKSTAPEPAKTPTHGARLPWKSDFDTSSSAARVFRSPSPTGVQHKWQPSPSFAAAGGHGGRRDTKDTPAPRHPVGGKTSHNISKELRQMKGKGGQMFAKRRAQAAEDERQEEDHPDSAPPVGPVNHATEPDVGGTGSARDQQQRLLDLIERTRATSPGRQWTSSTPNIAEHTVDPAAYGTFSPEVKSRGSFRPVKFRAPFGGSNQPAIDSTPGGISDF